MNDLELESKLENISSLNKIMGRKAKLKKQRQQQATAKSKQKYNETEFVQQFEQMGYQVKIDPKKQPKTNRGNVAPEIPQARIDPKL